MHIGILISITIGNVIYHNDRIKWQYLNHMLFGCDFEDAHDAMADITATKKCFFEMRKRGLI